MPRYFFDVYDGSALPDEIGAEFADIDAAHLEAVRLSGMLIKEDPQRFMGVEGWRIDIRAPLSGVVRRISVKTSREDLAAGDAPGLRGLDLESSLDRLADGR